MTAVVLRVKGVRGGAWSCVSLGGDGGGHDCGVSGERVWSCEGGAGHGERQGP